MFSFKYFMIVVNTTSDSRMKLYRYLTGPDDAQFCARVSKALNQGWTLYGSPTMSFNGTQIIVGQAIIKEVDSTYDPDADMLETLKQNAQKLILRPIVCRCNQNKIKPLQSVLDYVRHGDSPD